MSIFSKKTSPQVRRTQKNSGKGKRSGGGVFSLWIEVFVFLFLAFLLYTLGSLFSFRTGAWGEHIRFSLMRNWGGGIIIPIFFGGYVCISYFLKTGAKGILRQLLGTFILFLCAALLLGLFRMANIFQEFAVLSPGYLGDGLAIFFTRNIGSLGTLLLGIAFLILSATLYGFLHPAAVVAKISLLFKTLASDQWKRMPRPENMSTNVSVPVEFQPEEPPLFSSAPNFHDTGLEEGLLENTTDLSLGHENGIEEPPERSVENFPVYGTSKSPESPSTRRCDFSSEQGDKNEERDVFCIPSVQDQDEGKKKRREIDDSLDDSFQLAKEPDQEDDPHALPEIKFNELEGTGKKVRGAVFPPPLDLFGPRQQVESTENNETVKEQAKAIIATLADFTVGAEMADVVIGPTVIQFQMQLAPGIKVSKVAGLSNDLAVALTVPSLRVEAPIPGKPYVGVEIPNPKRRGISIRTILESSIFQETEFDLPLPMGVRVDSRPLVVGLEDLPHLLVAGTTGSGKSVFVTSCITGLCSHRSPEELRFILIDPKRVELSIYENLPHVLAKPVVSPKKAVQALAWAVREMEHRYEIFARARVRNLKSYNQCVLPKAQLPNIVIVVDELADLMFTAQKEVEDYICRLAQMARATGIHLILATQRPSVNVITGLIKANVPARVAFTLPSQTDSRTIIDVSGAERLLGKGDMLFVSSRYPRPLRVQSPFIDDGKSIEIINYLRNVFGDPEYVDIEDQGTESSGNGDTTFADDPLLEEAVDIVLNTGIASASRLQRQLRVGFTRAARLIDTMEQIGIVGPPEGSKPREILVDDDRARELLCSATGEAEE